MSAAERSQLAGLFAMQFYFVEVDSNCG